MNVGGWRSLRVWRRGNRNMIRKEQAPCMGWVGPRPHPDPLASRTQLPPHLLAL